MGEPSRGYSWPPFQPGHTLSLKHGADSDRAIAARAEEIHGALLDAAPYLDEPRFLPAVSRYLQAAARETLLHQHIVETSEAKGPAAVSSRLWEQATAAARLSSKLGSDLGLDPIGHARIRALSVGAEATQAGLSELQDRGRRHVERRRAELKGNDDD